MNLYLHGIGPTGGEDHAPPITTDDALRDEPSTHADVVITNPTHYAVALRYDLDEAAAPRVLVKGIRKRALRIKELALQNNVHTIEDRPLARALYDSVAEDQEIPPELFPAVAAILAEVYRQRGN